MSKIPKFRVWDNFRKRMFYNLVSINYNFWDEGDCEFLNGIEVNDFDDNKELCNFDVSLGHEILMQYTGLKDKNGKEIYEGDIVRVNCCQRIDDIDIFSEDIQEVYFDSGMFSLDPEVCFASLHESDNIEIIGNKYENPELLEKVDE